MKPPAPRSGTLFCHQSEIKAALTALNPTPDAVHRTIAVHRTSAPVHQRSSPKQLSLHCSQPGLCTAPMHQWPVYSAPIVCLCTGPLQTIRTHQGTAFLVAPVQCTNVVHQSSEAHCKCGVQYKSIVFSAELLVVSRQSRAWCSDSSIAPNVCSVSQHIQYSDVRHTALCQCCIPSTVFTALCQCCIQCRGKWCLITVPHSNAMSGQL